MYPPPTHAQALPPRPELVIVACGQSKRPRAAVAADLYIGNYYRACAAYAHRLVGVGGWRRVLILSAKWGLLNVTDWTQPYGLRLSPRRKSKRPVIPHPERRPFAECLAQVQAQAAARNLLDAAPVVVLGGKVYAELVREIWPAAEWPLEGKGGIGQQIQWLRERSGK